MLSLSKLALLLAVTRYATALPADDIEARGRNKVRSAFDLTQPVIPSNAEVITYDGPTYSMTADDWDARENATANGLPWDAPAGVPRITLHPGQLLDFGITNDITKRSGDRFIGAFGGYDCPTLTYITGVKNFGCGTGCITITTSALSGIVQQQHHKLPYPTMDIWGGAGCRGGRLQHFGVDDTLSCTNVNNVIGFSSFIGYYDCHH